MTVWVLRFEGNTDHTSGVIGVYATEADAHAARDAEIEGDKAEGRVVYGEADDDEEDGDDPNWEIDYTIEDFEVKTLPLAVAS